ncbi:hypothetical protein LCGC14_0146380 [marine sediment metagenome]|uniref:Uncharacterized protein n=1 Tax=marine sediment metagenome TaxID=412755 RepID=A0A0F9VFF5_9ZZZZ
MSTMNILRASLLIGYIWCAVNMYESEVVVDILRYGFSKLALLIILAVVIIKGDKNE